MAAGRKASGPLEVSSPRGQPACAVSRSTMPHLRQLDPPPWSDAGAPRQRTPSPLHGANTPSYVVLLGALPECLPFRRRWARGLGHDLRRSAARDFRRQGVSEGEIMKLCGWKTRATFDRYDIIDEADLAEAVAKRFKGQPTANKRETMANIGTPTAQPSPLSCSPV